MLTAILVTFAAAAAAPLLYKAAGRWAGYLLAAVPFGVTLWFASLLPDVLAGQVPAAVTPWFPSLGIDLAFRADGWSLLFALLVGSIGTLVVVYAAAYLEGDARIGRFFLWLFAFMGSMLGAVLSDHLIALFVFWELTSLTSYFLIGFYHEEERSRQSALQALIVTGTGGLCLLAGFLLLGAETGTWRISELITAGPAALAGLSAAALPLILLGAFTKSAQFPFHFWLPNAMAAPAPVSSYLHSSTMVKAGVFLLARLSPLFAADPVWRVWLPAAGLATLVCGAVLAVRESDMKRQLAYVTVASLGILTLLLGLGTPGAAKAAVAFLFAHALYKGALFMVAGAVDHAVHVRDAEKLGGLAKAMPFTAFSAALAGLSMASVPPIFGFIAKEKALEALLHAPGGLWPAAVLTGAAVVFTYLFWLVGVKPFVGALETAGHKVHAPGFGLWIGGLILAAAGCVFGLSPNLVSPLLGAAAACVHPDAGHLKLALWHGVNLPLILSVVSIAAGSAAFLARGAVRRAGSGLWARIGRLLQNGPEKVYFTGMSGLIASAARVTVWIQHGYLRHYFRMIFVTLFVLTAAALWRAGRPEVPSVSPGWLDVIVCAAMITAALSAPFATGRLSTAAQIGAVGLCVTVVFVMYGAPDLAMTQFVVDILSVSLLAFVMYRLPRHRRRAAPASTLGDALIAAAGGTIVTVLMLHAAAKTSALSPSAEYFVQQSVPGGHGHNIVNVILVDFRGIDTMGEITVLAISGLGAYALLRLAIQGAAKESKKR
jgi:multicomponent Na+:H+ antiporter subunit A